MELPELQMGSEVEQMVCPKCGEVLPYNGTVCKCGSGFFRDIERTSEGGVKTEHTEMPLGDVKLTYLKKDGSLALQGDRFALCDFTIEGPLVDPFAVRSVVLPKLDYASTSCATVIVEQYVWKLGKVEEDEEVPALNTVGQLTLKRFGFKLPEDK